MPKLHAPSLALGALLAVGVSIVLGQASPQLVTGSWGPPKKGVINVFNEPGGSVNAGGAYVLYQVPSDHWLTITAASVTGVGCACGTDSCLRFAEQFGGSVTQKGFAGYSPAFDSESDVGWVFRPGSQVVITNIAPNGACSFATYSLLGYETRD